MPSIVLTTEQQAAADAAIKALQGNDFLFRIGGYAGTGKSTIMKYIVESLGGPGTVAVCAFTGKAASVLRRKGVSSAATIHSTIYEFDEEEQKFHLKPWVPVKYFAIDEGSMVASQQWEDLQSFGKPILVIGDPGQLEPVGEDPHLMRDPDVVLEKIHRQAELSAIVEFADVVRRGRPWKHGVKGAVSILKKSEAEKSIGWADQFLCGFNKTRVGLNAAIRAHKGLNGELQEGERIICLSNSRELGVYNGQQFTIDVVRDREKTVVVADIRDDGGFLRTNIPIWLGNFGQEKTADFNTLKRLAGKMVADYGYCTTVHKFQGSEADKVAVIDEQCGVWDPVRWRYTAITRASQELRYFL